MDKFSSIAIPRETVNDDTVTIAKWHVVSGSKVIKGHELFDIETSKATITVEAECDGHVEILRRDGEEVAVGEEVGRLHPAAVAAAPAATGMAPAVPAAQAVSQKAAKLIQEHGLDPAVFGHLSLVREADVQRYLDERRQGGGTGISPVALVVAPDPSPSVPEASPSPREYGAFHDAFSSGRSRGRGILWLAANYFFRNYLLGLLVRIAPRGVILPLHRLRGVKMGEACYIDPTALVETAYPEYIQMGDDVRIAAHAVIMAHIKAPHYLRETGIVPSVLKPVVLEDHCFIGVNAVVMPGVRVGKAAVVASGSVVLADVPPFTLVAGNPAKAVKNFTPS